ncbi:mynd finger domain-containing protein [Cystoisospora suis]|uniref:Mynd finger domain-containing protein n=1 Tax=Cystoisospora suis TaxID=483139 RepID=A0A2C6KKM6_9APIC|nr:mynd finger domain-containing protein [Cystoisospora suis]
MARATKDGILSQFWGGAGQDPELTPYIAEELVQRLQTIDLKDVGSPEWFSHHEIIERLNLYAHQQATTATDEFIMSTVATAGKIYHEALVVNFLEVLLYHRTAAQAAEDHLVDLVDYINRKIVDISELHGAPLTVESIKAGVSLDSEEMQRQQRECEFKISMTCLSILRFITDHRSALPVTVTTRLLDQHDVLLSLVSLMERKPWYKTKSNGETEFFEDQQWIPQRSDEASMPKVQAQVWLTIYNLVMDQECRNRYDMTSYRRDNLLRLRRFLNETVHDQIPPLMDLHRCLEQLAISGQHPTDNHSIPPILVEMSADVRENLLKRYEGKWAAVVERQKEFSSKGSEHLDRLSKFMVSMPFDTVTSSKRCRTCGRHAEQRCAKCKAEWYCSRECQIGDWKNHKEVCSASSST